MAIATPKRAHVASLLRATLGSKQVDLFKAFFSENNPHSKDFIHVCELLYIAAAQPDMNHLQLTCIGIETRRLEHSHLSDPSTPPSHLQFVK